MTNECCGTCMWHLSQTKVIGVLTNKASSNVVVEWFCNNKRSDYYTDFTDYDDTCDEWEDRT